MINAISNIHELDRLLRNMIIAQSGLDGSRVLNSISIRGQDLEKMIDDKVYSSYDLNDSVILFEVRARNEENESLSMTDEDDSLIVYAPYEIHFVIYGNMSGMLAQVLKARIETEKNRDDMRNEGIQIEKVSNIETLNEFKNETVWIRNDFSIEFACMYKVEQDSKYEDYDDVQVTKLFEVVD